MRPSSVFQEQIQGRIEFHTYVVRDSESRQAKRG